MVLGSVRTAWRSVTEVSSETSDQRAGESQWTDLSPACPARPVSPSRKDDIMPAPSGPSTPVTTAGEK